MDEEKKYVIVIIVHDVDIIKDLQLDEFEEPGKESEFIKKYESFCSKVADVLNADVDIDIINPHDITQKLSALYLNIEADIIIITGDIAFIKREYVDDTIQAITTNREQLSTELVNLMTKIEKDLEKITHYRITCGIHESMLLINLSGSYEDKEACFVAISHMLENMIYLIRKSENKQFSPEITRSIHNDVLEQNVCNDANCNCHKELFATISLHDVRSKLSEVTFKGIKRCTKEEDIVETVKISEAYGRIAGRDIHSNYNVPPFRTSSKHGYAVLVKDGKGLRKVKERENKFPPPPLRPGTCVWVNTGEPIPEGATAVVSVKDATLKSSSDDENKYIEIKNTPRYGQNIKTVGSDLIKDEIIVKGCTRIGPEETALLTISGYKEIEVIKQLSIGVLSIGGNLTEPGETLKSGFVYDINRVTLMSLLKQNGYSSMDYGIVKNKESSIKKKIMKTFEVVDILVTTGSVNDKDLLKNILIHCFEATIHFGNVYIKPGKSTILASCKVNGKERYFWCLSGNPTTALIVVHLFLLPFLNLLHGFFNTEPLSVSVQTKTSFPVHHCTRIVWSYVDWSNKGNVARINVYENRLCNIMVSNALLLLLPKEKENEELSETDNLRLLLVEYPRNYDRITFEII